MKQLVYTLIIGIGLLLGNQTQSAEDQAYQQAIEQSREDEQLRQALEESIGTAIAEEEQRSAIRRQYDEELERRSLQRGIEASEVEEAIRQSREQEEIDKALRDIQRAEQEVEAKHDQSPAGNEMDTLQQLIANRLDQPAYTTWWGWFGPRSYFSTQARQRLTNWIQGQSKEKLAILLRHIQQEKNALAKALESAQGRQEATRLAGTIAAWSEIVNKIQESLK